MLRLTVLSLIPSARAHQAFGMAAQVPIGILRWISASRTRAAKGSRAWVIFRVIRPWLTPSHSAGEGARCCDGRWRAPALSWCTAAVISGIL